MDKRRSKTMSSLINNILKYLILVFCFLAILEVYNISTKGLITSLGVVGVVAGLAFQDTLKDLLAGFSIIFENKYAVGDIITIGDFRGKVISLGLKTTKIQSTKGEIKIISNSNITEVINHSLDDAYEFIDIPVSYEEKIEKVEKVLTNLCQKLINENKDLLEAEVLGVNDLDSSSVNFRIMIKTKFMKQYDMRREILKQVKMEFDKQKINIPYNQVVVHNARI
jgi:small conductance mechanosensitive channel